MKLMMNTKTAMELQKKKNFSLNQFNYIHNFYISVEFQPKQSVSKSY